jgi:hypothetical protein
MRNPNEPNCSDCWEKDKENCPHKEECIAEVINKQDEFREERRSEK